MKNTNLLTTVLSFVISLVLTANLAASENTADDFTFVVLSDTQLGFSTKDKDLSIDIESFNKAVDYINRTKPAFVLINGDLINSPYPGKIRDTETAEFKKILSKIDNSIPVHLVIGNHELDNTPKPEALQWAEKTFGKSYYSFTFGKCHFIVLNSTIIVAPKKVKTESAAQKEWLLKELAAIPADEKANTIIVQHHPYFVINSNEKDHYANIPGKIRKEYLEILRSNGIRLLLCGHLHCHHITADMGIKEVVCGPTSLPLGPGKKGLMTVKFSNGKFDFNFQPFTPDPAEKPALQAQ